MTNPPTVPNLPRSENTLLIRTHFSDETAWQALRTAVNTPTEDGFVAYVHVVDDHAYRDLSTEQLVALAAVDQEQPLDGHHGDAAGKDGVFRGF